MKKNWFVRVGLVLFLMLSVVSCGTTQSAAERQLAEEELRVAIQGFDFVFKADYAYPSGYRGLYLSPGYDVDVSQEEVKVHLPYFGQSHTAPMNMRGGGIQFESNDFQYDVRQGKKADNWLVDIRVKDKGNEYYLYFDIWENGRTSLNVSDTRRQSISFSGTSEVKKKEE